MWAIIRSAQEVELARVAKGDCIDDSRDHYEERVNSALDEPPYAFVPPMTDHVDGDGSRDHHDYGRRRIGRNFG